MTGIVFTELLGMVENNYGYGLVDQILMESDLPSRGIYTTAGTYDYVELIILVNKLSQKTNIPVTDLLYTFGQYMFVSFTRTRPHLIDSCDSAFSLLSSIQHFMHVEVHKLYPNAELPHFTVQRLSVGHITLLYTSERKLGNFAHGLIDGCFAHFGETATVVKTNLVEDGSEVLFDIVK